MGIPEGTMSQLENAFGHSLIHWDSHASLYTGTALASLIAERITDHLRDVEHRSLRH
jgi:hypothetical protein